ncbi:hypothetical protein RSAG8_00603, partial [Rhizoctonia solani AG-8 WAC10335]
MLAQCTSSPELGLTTMAKLWAMVERPLVNRAREMLIQLRQGSELLVTEVAFVGTPIPATFSLSCQGLSYTSDESVRVGYKVGPVAFRNETVQALACEARLAAA